MTEILLAASRTMLILSTLIFAIGGVIHLFGLLTSINVIKHSKWSLLFQGLLSAGIFSWAWQSLTVLTMRQQGILPPALNEVGYAFIPAIILGIYLTWRTKHWHYPLVVFILLINLPFLTPFMPAWMAFVTKWLLTIEGLAWVYWIKGQREKSLGPVALKNAFDNLPSGLAFYDHRGRILMMNWRLRSYLRELQIADMNSWDTVSSRLLEKRLKDNPDSPGEDQFAVKLPSGMVVLFTMEDLSGGRQKLRQLYATDITERYRLDTELKEQTLALEQNLQRVKELIHVRQQAAEQNTFLAARTRLHDVLAQRMSLVHRFVEDRVDSPDRIGELVTLLSRLREDLLDTPQSSQLSAEYQSLLDSIRLVGLSIHVSGRLPESVNYRQIFVEMLRECATNTLVHSDAHRLYVDIETSPDAVVWIFTNAIVPGSRVSKGTGLEGMRRRVETLGGSFSYEAGENFIVRAQLPPEP